MALLRERVPARLFILGHRRAGAGASRQRIAERTSRRRGGVVRISEQSLEVHRARRRVRADVALRGIRQRARRSDGLRCAGRRDQFAGHARDRAATASTGCWSIGTKPARWPSARADPDRRRASGSVCPRAHGRARSDSRCRRSPPLTIACWERPWRERQRASAFHRARFWHRDCRRRLSASSTRCRR